MTPCSEDDSSKNKNTKLTGSQRPSIKHHVINPQDIETASIASANISPSLSVSSSIKNQDISSLAIASTAKSQLSSGYRYTKGSFKFVFDKKLAKLSLISNIKYQKYIGNQ